MPRFFFHVHDGTTMLDDEGTVLPNVDTARKMAVTFAGELLRDLRRDVEDGEDWKVDVADEHGLILFTVMLSALDAPAGRHAGTRGLLNPG